MSPEENQRERAALPPLPPRRRTGANLIRTNRVSEALSAQRSSVVGTEDGAVAGSDSMPEPEARSATQPLQPTEAPAPHAAYLPSDPPENLAADSVGDLAPAHQDIPGAPNERAKAASGPPRSVRSPVRSTNSSEAGEAPAALSRWDQLNRRIFSVADPQVEELVELRKALMRLPARQRVLARDRERITESTLVRIGIDLVLRHRDQIEGVTEDELRASLGLEPLRLRVDDSGPANESRR